MNDSAGRISCPVLEGRGAAAYCPHCGYSLADIHVEVCPECGGRFDRSLLAYTFEHARRLHIGIGIAEFATVIAIFGSAPAAIVFDVVGRMAGLSAAAERSLVSLYDLGVSALLCFGWWLFATPHAIEQQLGPNLRRRLLRTVVVAKLAIAMCVCILSLGAGAIPVLPPTVVRIADWSGTVAMCAVAGAAIGYLQVIARRLGAPRLWRSGKTHLFLLAWLAGAFVLVLSLGTLTAVPGVGSRTAVRLLLGVPITLGACLWYVFYIVMVDSFRRLVLRVRIWHWRAEEKSAPHPGERAAG